MLMPPHSYAKGRQAEERRHEHARLMRIAKPARFSLLDKVMARTGDLLIAVGRELHEQCGVAQTVLDNPVLRSNH